jgi:hypothetical protein
VFECCGGAFAGACSSCLLVSCKEVVDEGEGEGDLRF